MTNDDHVTNKDLYQEIMKLHDKMDSIVITRVAPLERAVDRIYVYVGIVGIVASAIITISINYIKEKILNI